MKSDVRADSDGSARHSPKPERAGGPKRSFRRTILATVVIVAMVAAAAFAARHLIAGLLLTRGVGLFTGDRVTIGSFRVGWSRGEFDDVHVTTPGGDPLFDARRIVLRYTPGALQAANGPRYGIDALTIDEPVFSIVRSRDGHYNIGRQSGGGGGSPAGSGAPWLLDVRVRGGELRLIDRAPVARDLAEQRIVGIALDARIRSDRRSVFAGRAAFESRRSRDAAVSRWPLALRATVDYPRGIAIARLAAAQLPLRGPIGFLQHSSAVRIDDGILDGVVLRLYALDIAPNQPLNFHVGGTAQLHDGRLEVGALRRPVRAVRGALTLVDDGVWSPRLTGELAGIPIVARGGAFDRLAPVLRIGVRGDGDLRDLRLAFGFAQLQPVSGTARIETLLEAPVSGVLIRTAIAVEHGRYANVPIDRLRGRVDYHAGAVVLDGVRARYGAAAVDVGARFLLGGPFLDSAIVAAAHAPGRSVPYAENLAPDARVDLAALFTGGAAGFRVRGALGTAGGTTAGEGLFAVDELGYGEFGPFVLRRPDGSSIVGALALDRPLSRSAAWVSADRFRVAVPLVPSRLAGLSVPPFPPVAGVIDGDVAGAGPPGAFALSGSLHGTDLRVGNARLGAGSAALGGTLSDVRLAQVRLHGPAGAFDGSAAAAAGAFALRGAYDGSLEALEPFTGKQDAAGAVRGNVLARIRGADVVVQSPGAVLHHGRIRGVALDAATGTIAVRGKTFRLLAGAGTIAGAQAVAADAAGAIAVSAPDLPASALRGTGLPLDAGRVSAYGLADLRGAEAPRFDGDVAVADGRAAGYRVAGNAHVALAGSRAEFSDGTGTLGATFGTLTGSISGIGRGPLAYDLRTQVGLGDIAVLARDLGVPVRHLAGSFAADLAVRGRGAQPEAAGRLEVPEGVLNGLAFGSAGASIDLRAGRVAARNGTLTVGSTVAAFDADADPGRRGYDLTLDAPHANLADLDDYFDTSGTIGGRGSLAFALRAQPGLLVTHGAIALRDAHFRAYPLGDATLAWGMHGRTIAGRAGVRSPGGTFAGSAAVVPGEGDLRRALLTGNLAGSATFTHIDLGRWLDAAGSSLPLRGFADARVQVAGRLPTLATRATVSLTDARAGAIAIRSAHLRAAGSGSRVTVSEADADVGFAQLAGDGLLGLGPHDPLAFDLRVTADDIAAGVHRFIPVSARAAVAGKLAADVRVSGTREAPAAAGGFELTDVRYGGLSVPRSIGEVAVTGKRVEVRDAEVTLAHGSALVTGSLPLVLSPFAIGPPDAAVSLDVTARSVDLSEFIPLLPAGTQLAGTIDGRIGVEGTVGRPDLAGSLTVAGGSYTGPVERAPISNVGARLDFAGTSVALRSFHAGLGKGTLDGDAFFELPSPDRAAARYSARVTAKAATFDLPAYGRGTLDGTLALSKAGRIPLISGAIVLSHAVIPVSAVYGAGGPKPAAGAGAFALDPRLNFTASAGDDVRVRSAIVDIGVEGGVNVTGTLAGPRLSGGFDATDGTISSYNHVFRILNASVAFDPADGTTPTIAARAVARVPNPDPDPSRNISGAANIYVTVSGTADDNNLQVTYSSDPAYSQEQIVGLLLDVPALLGAVSFDLNGGPGSPRLRGAPGETNALLPPGITPEQVSAVSFNEEVFSLLNGQFTQRALGPLERVFQKNLGLSDIQFTADYGGGIGYSLRRQIGKRDFYAFLSQTVTYPERANLGFELVPRAFETVNFSVYAQNGVTSLITNQTPGEEYFGSNRRLTSVQPLGNRAGVSVNLSRRF